MGLEAYLAADPPESDATRSIEWSALGARWPDQLPSLGNPPEASAPRSALK